MKSEREITLVVIQGGPASGDPNQNLSAQLELIDQAARFEPDFVLLNELFAFPTWPFRCSPEYFRWAEPLSGDMLCAVAERARKHSTNIVAPFFERENSSGAYFNSAAIIDRKGEFVSGRLPGGTMLPCYRKNHLPVVVYHTADGVSLPYNEEYYFSPGDGFPVFDTDVGHIGVLICADRCFPEAWRVLAIQGAQLVFVPAAIPSWKTGSGARREELFVAELRVRALENGIFVAAANKGGRELFAEADKTFFGASCIIDPCGQVRAGAPLNEGPHILSANFSLEEIDQARRNLTLLQMRRPKLYRTICESEVRHAG